MMKPWTQVVTPHEDIRKGKLDESVFAADLSDVVADRGPLEYRDAEIFFRKTYRTQGLANLLATVLGRLAGTGGGEGVIQIQTPFGGGKTHSLIALYHAVRRWGLGIGDSWFGIGEPQPPTPNPQPRVVTFVGTAADALKGRTPWGELAAQLGRYDLLKEHDTKRRTPGKNLLHELLSAQPTLILMDEIAEYAVKAKDFRDQVVAFFQELTEAVKVLPRCVLVVTLPSSAPYGEEGARALHELQQIFKRVESIKTPVEGEEIYEVIRRRLFEDMGDPQEARRTADEFFEMYQRLGDDMPREVRETAYRDRMRKAYPFHPELIDILFERWSTFPDFQRTRGVLRILAQLVKDLYQKGDTAPLILPAHLNLANPAIGGEFLRHIGNEYQGVIASDIAARGNAKAEGLDREMGSEYARFGVASGLARAIFFGSFSGSEKRGVGIQRLRLAVLQPGLPAAIVGDALRRLEEELWYLHVESGMYQFSSQPNLNRVIVEKEEAVKPEQITEEMRTRLENLTRSSLRVILWPRDSQDVPDTKELKLALLSPEYARSSGGTEAFARELLEKCGQTFRTYRNTLLLLAADGGELAGARQQIKRYLALRSIRDDEALHRQLSGENRKGIESKLKDAEGGIDHRLLSAYRHLAMADEQGVRWLDLGLPTVGAKDSLAGRVREYLRGEERLLAKILPRHILEKAMSADEREKPVDQIYDAFLKYPQLPMLESKQVLLDAIAQGVREGVFGVQVGERVFFQADIALTELGAEAVLVREPKVAAAPSEPPPGAVVEPPPTTMVRETAAVAIQTKVTPAPTVQAYFLEAAIPWDKLSDFVRGVVRPLREDGAELEVKVTLKAQAENGIRETTLNQTVRETLKQIGATIVREEKR